MKVKITKKEGTIYHCSKPLKEEITNCKKEVERIEKQLPMYTMIFEKARKELEAKLNRLKYCKDFIVVAETKMKEIEKEISNTQETEVAVEKEYKEI